METQRELHKAGRRCCPPVPAEKQLLLTSPPPPGLEDLVWTVVSSSENKGARMRREKPEKMRRRCSGRAFISASDTAKAAWLLLGRKENATHFAAIKSSGPRLSEESARAHCVPVCAPWPLHSARAASTFMNLENSADVVSLCHRPSDDLRKKKSPINSSV